MISAPRSPSSRPVNGPGEQRSELDHPHAGERPDTASFLDGIGPVDCLLAQRRLGVVADVGHEQVTRLEDVLAHDELRSFGVADAQCVRDLAVVVSRDPLLVGRIPDVRLVDERQLDHTPHHPAQPGAPRCQMDGAVEPRGSP